MVKVKGKMCGSLFMWPVSSWLLVLIHSPTKQIILIYVKEIQPNQSKALNIQYQ